MQKIRKKINKIRKNIRRYSKEHAHYTLNELKINKTKIFFESYDGTNQTCNPYEIYEYLLNNPNYEHMEFVWSYKVTKPTNSQFNNRKVTLVKHSSMKYFYELATSGYIVSNSTLPHQFTKKTGQIYLNTWHGIPLKKMGYDIPLGVPQTRNVIRNLLATDFIISSSPWMTEQIWLQAFRLRGIYNGRIIETGSPRTDRQFGLSSKSRESVRMELGIAAHDAAKKIVLYAPTWTGSTPHTVDDNFEILNEQREKLNNLLPSEEYLVLSKYHQLLLHRKNNINNNYIVNDSILVNKVLSVVDHLVTDQSSLMFDYLLEDKPVHFFVAPGTSEEISRGIYSERSSLPGSHNVSMEDVASSILSADTKASEAQASSDSYADRRREWREFHMPFDDGGATGRVVRRVFGEGGSEGEIRSTNNTSERGKRVLLHVGSLIPNGITTAAKTLVTELIDTGYDVTILYPFSNDSAKLEQAQSFDARARHLPRVGSIALPLHRRRAYRRFLNDGGLRSHKVNAKGIRKIFAREWRRCFGDAEYDYAIAFDGYSVFWAELILSGECKNNFVWLHNDLMQDSQRTISGKKPHHANLTSLFSLYNSFDLLISVSRDLNNINKIKLSKFASANKFVSVRNLISQRYVLEQSGEPLEVKLPPGGPRFVTVGRLSPEKNQARMVRAMKLVVPICPEAQLFIVGGGPLESQLRSLIHALGLDTNVHLLGYHTNPHVIVAKCDFFAFSSLYEGQGLAVIEAMVLGKPVVSTRYNVVNSVIGNEDGLITDPTDEALAAGMLTLIRDGHPTPSFDPTRHNTFASIELQNVMNRKLLNHDLDY